jgi:hypothetical protein
MEYCRPYAAQTVDLLVKYLWNRAYMSCLISDDDPAVAVIPADALKGVIVEIDLPPARPDKVAVDPPAPRLGRSGYAVNSPEWIAYCKKYWRSFNVNDGTVIQFGSRHKRTPCPG